MIDMQFHFVIFFIK